MSLTRSLTIEDAITGKPVVIENPLLAEHIAVGRLFWYYGFTSTGHWDCPGIITHVDKRKKRFRIRSLDDMKEQHGWEDFTVSAHSASSRKTMRLVDASTIKTYLELRRTKLREAVKQQKEELQSAQWSLEHFENIAATLNIE